jgi:GTP diphosphokinase / guanosine-3',5'-bis(diphosphate) 3'-diphosphatase
MPMEVACLSDLTEAVGTNTPSANCDDIERAFQYAEEHHRTQTRASGEPYITHPLAVAGILADKRLDSASIVTALLHDTVEDTSATYDEIAASFGEEIANLVNGVTKLTKLELRADQSKQAENFRKLVISMSRDIRVLLVKLADRLHNMRTLYHITSPAKRHRIARETMEIYAPLAERIGMQDWKDELTDLAFRELHPEARASVIARLDYLRQHGQDLIGRVLAELRNLLKEEGIPAEVLGREKLPHSIWEKMKKKNVPFEQITDIMAFRIIVNDVGECYHTLGCIHSHYRAILGRFKDYISVPKLNGYRSLHTTVIAPDNLRIEIQIRTREMHEVAEFGVAAHWHYKEFGEASGAAGPSYAGLRSIVDILDQDPDSDELLEFTRMQMYQDQVFCFTPKGELISLPQGATPVDFAYAVHSDIGDTCVGAKVNGKLVPLRTVLNNGDQIEITTSKNRSPSPEWLRFVVTGKAQARIRRSVRLRQREQYIQLGREIVRNAFAVHNADLSDRALAPAVDHFGYRETSDLYAAIGEGQIGERELSACLFATPPQLADHDEKVVQLIPTRRRRIVNKQPVAIRGLIPGLALHFARCCHPLPGDKIVGIVTTGKGVTIHTHDCASLESFHHAPERWLDVSWDPDAATANTARVSVVVENQPGKLADVSATIAQNRGNITNLRFTNRAEDFIEMHIDIQVADVSHLSNIIAALRAQPSVSSVNRVRS